MHNTEPIISALGNGVALITVFPGDPQHQCPGLRQHHPSADGRDKWLYRLDSTQLLSLPKGKANAWEIWGGRRDSSKSGKTHKGWLEPWTLRELRFKQPPGEWAKHLVLEAKGRSDPLEPWHHPKLTQFSNSATTDFILTLVSP